MPLKIILIIHNVRSAYNVGNLLRTAEGLGIEKVYITGISPYPKTNGDARLPHEALKVDRKISKTALGAQTSLRWQYEDQIQPLIKKLRLDGYVLAALEQTEKAIELVNFTPPPKIALVVGNEISGIEKAVLTSSDIQLKIPMLGTKESFNVSAAGAMALYHLRFAGLKEWTTKQ